MAMTGQQPQQALPSSDELFAASNVSYFTQLPKQLTPILLAQLYVPATTWTRLLSVAPRQYFTTALQFWVNNRTATPLDIYFAMVASGSTFNSGAGIVQDDVFCLTTGVVAGFRENNAQEVINPKQDLWVYSTQNCNLRISGWQVHS